MWEVKPYTRTKKSGSSVVLYRTVYCVRSNSDKMELFDSWRFKLKVKLATIFHCNKEICLMLNNMEHAQLRKRWSNSERTLMRKPYLHTQVARHASMDGSQNSLHRDAFRILFHTHIHNIPKHVAEWWCSHLFIMAAHRRVGKSWWKEKKRISRRAIWEANKQKWNDWKRRKWKRKEEKRIIRGKSNPIKLIDLHQTRSQSDLSRVK